MDEEKYYYQVYLGIWRNDEFFGMINISHISYEIFEEMFRDQFTGENFIFEDIGGYQINEDLHKKYKVFLDKEISFTFDFTLFEYFVSLCGDKIEKYKKDYYDELPKLFEERK